jgi:hypothetical protein
MRKRRVGVTARSRQIDGSQETGYPQFATEMAAPLELRTPKGTCGESCNQSADGSMVTMARESKGQKARRAELGREESGSMAGKERAGGAHEALPHTRPGGAPPETPAPFPWELSIPNGGNRSRVRKPRKNGAPLTDSHRSEESTGMRERGPSARRAASQIASQVGRGTARYARMRRCLILGQGARPLRPPQFSLDREGASHGSRDRQGAVASFAKECT